MSVRGLIEPASLECAPPEKVSYLRSSLPAADAPRARPRRRRPRLRGAWMRFFYGVAKMVTSWGRSTANLFLTSRPPHLARFVWPWRNRHTQRLPEAAGRTLGLLTGNPGSPYRFESCRPHDCFVGEKFIGPRK